MLQRVCPPARSLAARYPHLAAEWVEEKNLPYSPDETWANWTEEVWWKCSTCEYEFQRSPNYRVRRPNSCPACAGITLIPGVTSIPQELQDWLPARDVSKIHRGSKEKLDWSCPTCHHQFSRKVKTFVSNPICTRCTTTQRGGRSGSIKHPPISKSHLMGEWHPSKNADLNPQSISLGSAVKAWWVCPAGHEWLAAIYARVNGSGCPECAVKNRIVVVKTSLAQRAPMLVSEWHPTKNGIVTPDTVSYGSSTLCWWLCTNGHAYAARPSDRLRDRGCPKCSKAQSKGELEVKAFLESILPPGTEIVERNRKLLGGYEMDLYLPAYKLGVEYNGLYWHSEAQKSRDYHEVKADRADAAGIRLIQVWEDDWQHKRSLVEGILREALSIYPATTPVDTRPMMVKPLRRSEAVAFFEAHHIAGAAPGSSYGLVDAAGAILAAATFRKRGDTLYVQRYASSFVIPGGLGRLLQHVEGLYSDVTSVVAFADRCVSDGAQYERLGFTAEKALKPGYAYLHQGRRQDKSGFGVQRWRDDSAFQYEDGLSERELADLNGVLRVWDAGRIRWVRRSSVV